MEKAKHIKAVILDADGVIFGGGVLIGNKDPEGDIAKGEVLKQRSHVDGQGISFLRAAGIRVAFITAESTGFLEMLGKKLNSLPSVKDGTWPPIGVFAGQIGKDKVATAEKWLAEIGVTWEECAYMGDDIGDFKVMEKVGLPACPSQAEEEIKAISAFIAPRPGGMGAIRDLSNFILKAKGIDKTKLAFR